MSTIFVSYRRDDSAGIAGRIFDRLVSRYGHEGVFMDVDSIPAGVDFRQHIAGAVAKCRVLLAVIGERWHSVSPDGGRRLDDPGDFVRIEIETALMRNIQVVPVLIGRADMPCHDELPPSLGELAFRNAARVDAGRDFHPHVDRLIRELDFLLADAEPREPSTALPEGHERVPASRETLEAFIVLSHGTEDARLRFDASEDRRVMMGRSRECAIPLPSPHISRQHAMIIFEPRKGWMLQDLGSHDGTALNGSRIEKGLLKVGDRIEIGGYTLWVREIG